MGVTKVFLFANNYVGYATLRYIKQAEARGRCELVGLCVHPEDESHKYRRSIISLSGLPRHRIFNARDLVSKRGVDAIRELGADVALAMFFSYIIKEPVLSLFPDGIINLHPSYLPYNRGSYPVVWAILEGTPAGATLHYLDAGVDTGPIIEQVRVPVEPTDTGQTLHNRCQKACVDLFAAWWPRYLDGERKSEPQPYAPPARKRADVACIDRLDMDAPMRMRWLLDLLRARTFDQYPGCYFEQDGHRVYVRVQLIDEWEMKERQALALEETVAAK